MRKNVAVLAGLLLSAATPAHAAEPGLSFELTPYVWFAGVDGEVTVRGHTVDVDLPFEDLLDAVEVGGMLLGSVQYGKWVALAQLDYVSMSTDNLDNPPARGTLDSKMFMGNLGVGYQFGGMLKAATLDILVGTRILYLKNELTLDGIGTFEKSRTIADALLFVRPSLRLVKWLRFNPIVAVGTGDSDFTYELQPQLQFQILKNLAARAGYRRVWYNLKGAGEEARFKGAISGFLVGLGVTF